MTTAAARLETIERETGPRPVASIIWMHGLGADAHDFEPVVPMLAVSARPMRFVFPNAPVRPVTINGGARMRAWYDIRGVDLSAREDAEGFAESRRAIEALMEAEVARGIPPSRLFLGGFSQGAAVTLHVGLRHTQALAGLVVLSGYLAFPERLAHEASAANRRIPLFMGHGEYDQVVPLPLAERSRAALEAFGYALKFHTYRMPHSVVNEELADIRAFLADALR